MNYFLALQLAQETTEGLAQFVERWKPLLPPELIVRWVEPESYHVTLLVTNFALMQTLPPESRAKDSKSRYNIVHTFPFGTQAEP